MTIPTASYNKFAGVRAPILGNTSGTFTMPGFTPFKSFPYPGIVVGNASQFDGLLTGSNRSDMVAANMYRIQDKMDDVSAGPGATGLNSASKGNASGRSINLTSPNKPMISASSPQPRPFLTGLSTPVKIKKEQEDEDARIRGSRAAQFDAATGGAGDSKENPLNVTGAGLPLRVHFNPRAASTAAMQKSKLAVNSRTGKP